MFWRKTSFPYGLKEDIPLSTPINELSFLVFDTEATGFQIAAEDRLIEIAGVPMKGTEVLEKETFQTLVNPGREIPEIITDLTGITDERVTYAPPAIDAIEEFFQFAEKYTTNCLVGHYVAFDLLVLKQELLREKFTLKKPPAIDTLNVIGYLAPSWDMRDLERYAMAFGTRIYERHRALGDSLTTAYLFQELLLQVMDRGVDTWGELLRITESAERHLKT